MNNPPLVRKIVIIAVVLLLAVLYLAFFFRSNRDDLSGNPEKANQALDRAVKGGVLQNCAQLRGVVVSGTDYEAVCRRNIALAKAEATLDPSYCSEIADPVSANNCAMSVAFASSQRSGDPGVCDQILTGEAASFCKAAYWSEKAVNDSDIKLCDNLPGGDLALACRSKFNYESFLKSPGSVPCGDIPASLARECTALKSAIKSKRIGDCMSLSDPAMKTRCVQLINSK